MKKAPIILVVLATTMLLLAAGATSAEKDYYKPVKMKPEESKTFPSGPDYKMMVDTAMPFEKSGIAQQEARAFGLVLQKTDRSKPDFRESIVKGFVGVVGEMRARRIGLIFFDETGTADYWWPGGNLTPQTPAEGEEPSEKEEPADGEDVDKPAESDAEEEEALEPEKKKEDPMKYVDIGNVKLITKYGTIIKGDLIRENEEWIEIEVAGGRMKFRKRSLTRIVRESDIKKARMEGDSGVISYNDRDLGVGFEIKGGSWEKYAEPPPGMDYVVQYAALGGEVTITLLTMKTAENTELEAFLDRYRYNLERKYNNLVDLKIKRGVSFSKLPSVGLSFYSQKEGRKFYEERRFCLWKEKAFILAFTCMNSYKNDFESIYDGAVKSFLIGGIEEDDIEKQKQIRERSPYAFVNENLGVSFEIPKKGWSEMNLKKGSSLLAAYTSKFTGARIVFDTDLLGEDQTLEQRIKQTRRIKKLTPKNSRSVNMGDLEGIMVRKDILSDKSLGTEEFQVRVDVYAAKERRVYNFTMMVRSSYYDDVIGDFMKIVESFKFLDE